MTAYLDWVMLELKCNIKPNEAFGNYFDTMRVFFHGITDPFDWKALEQQPSPYDLKAQTLLESGPKTVTREDLNSPFVIEESSVMGD